MKNYLILFSFVLILYLFYNAIFATRESPCVGEIEILFRTLFLSVIFSMLFSKIANEYFYGNK